MNEAGENRQQMQERLAAQFAAHRCSLCGSSDVVSVYPGSEPDRPLGPQTLPWDVGQPTRFLCRKCLLA